jgi:hypothetical protein
VGDAKTEAAKRELEVAGMEQGVSLNKCLKHKEDKAFPGLTLQFNHATMPMKSK